MIEPMSEQMVMFLREILDLRAPELRERLCASSVLSEEDRAAIINELTDELCDSGIDKLTSEPNERGMLIEQVIDHFVRMSLEARRN